MVEMETPKPDLRVGDVILLRDGPYKPNDGTCDPDRQRSQKDGHEGLS